MKNPGLISASHTSMKAPSPANFHASLPDGHNVNNGADDDGSLVKDMKTAKEQGWGKITPVLPPPVGEPY